MIKATKIYARFASEVYDDFGESYSEQEYYRKEHADEEIRATKYALWMARALRALTETCYYVKCRDYYKQSSMKYSYGLLIKKWKWVERKCREKVKEFE